MFEVVAIIILLIFGLVLIFAEVIFVPGTTFVGLFGIIFSGIGIYLTFENFGSTIGWIVLVANILLLAWAIIYGFKAEVWKRFSLQTSIDSTFNSDKPIRINIGDVGKTLSDLRPIGKAEFNGKIVEVKTLGTLVYSGASVKVIKLEHNSIIVETFN